MHHVARDVRDQVEAKLRALRNVDEGTIHAVYAAAINDALVKERIRVAEILTRSVSAFEATIKASNRDKGWVMVDAAPFIEGIRALEAAVKAMLVR